MTSQFSHTYARATTDKVAAMRRFRNSVLNITPNNPSIAAHLGGTRPGGLFS